MNICGVLVHARPERAGEVGRALAAMPGVEIHAVGGDGRLVVSVEDTPGSFTADVMAGFHRVEGVINAALVYHHCESDEDLEQEVPA